MKIAVFGDKDLYAELSASKNTIDWKYYKHDEKLANEDASAFIILSEEVPETVYAISKPVFVGMMNETAAWLKLPDNFLRFNAWPGFIARNVWEVAGNFSPMHKTVLEELGKTAINCADVPGFPAARIIAMIVNEAFFAVDDEVSTDEEIDTAMKLGTNYPYGPFEWCNHIGGKRILSLLQRLAHENERYKPAPALLKAYQKEGWH